MFDRLSFLRNPEAACPLWTIAKATHAHIHAMLFPLRIVIAELISPT